MINREKGFYLRALSDACMELVLKKRWRRDWQEAGCYLMLECSEFIEAIRGKNGDPVEEAGDILFVLLTTMSEHNIDVGDVLDFLANKVRKLGQ